MGNPAPPSPRRAPGGSVLVALVALGVLVVLGLAPAAAVTASRMPQPLAPAVADLPDVALDATTRIRRVPVGLPAGTRIRTVEDVRPVAVGALGADAADRLLSLLAVPSDGYSWPPLGEQIDRYPFRFTVVDRVLGTADATRLEERGAALGAALTLLAVDPDAPGGIGLSAGRIAFAVLDAARAGGACDPQLNLLAVVASEPEVAHDIVASEVAKTVRACPDDPTPGWLHTQRSLHEGSDQTDVTSVDGYVLDPLRRGTAAATALVRRFPADPGVLATLGDAYLATGTALARAQPFTSRRAFQDAARVFARVQHSEETGAAALGAARAELGLGRPEPAARLAAQAAAASERRARALQLTVTAQEAAHQWATAARLARELAGVGPAGFPEPTAVVPLGPPLSLGSDTLTPAAVTIIAGGQGGGALVADEGFIPAYREVPGLTDAVDFCPEWAWRRDALLAGDPGAAVAQWPKEFDTIDPTDFDVPCPDGDALKRQLDSRLAGGLPTDVEDETVRDGVESLMDDRQHLLRWAGDLAAARRETVVWAAHLGEGTALAQQRLGEIDYLRGDFVAAAADFAEAVVRWRVIASGNDLAVHQAQLGQAAALLRTGRADDAEALLRVLVVDGAQGYGYQESQNEFGSATAFATVSYYAATLLADHELAEGNDAAASEHLAAALVFADTLDREVHLDAARNSAAVAALGTGDTPRAIAFSRAAVEADPASPVYLMTAADVAQRAGDTANAVRQARAALASDPTAFPTANNLGVLLARQGRFTEASQVLRGAVHANPGYALGWFNLGIVEGRRGPLHVVPSQGALGRATSLDATYADRPHHTVLDTTTYRTGLDVSKPIPAGWSFAGSQRRAPVVTLGLLAAVLAGIGLVSLRDPRSSGARDWLESLGGRIAGMPVARRMRRPWWAVLATVGAFLLAFWREPLWPWTGVAYTVGVVALVGAGMVARWLVARRRVGGVVHGTWSPGVLVGLASGAFGVPIAPLPVVRAPARDARVAVAAPLTLAVLSLALLLEAALLHTPLTTSLCVAAFIMAGSVLLPVRPLDGSRAGAAGVVGAAGLLGAVLVLGLNLV